MKSFIVAITGASGSIYGLKLVKELLKSGHRVYLCVSDTAFLIIMTETGVNWSGRTEADTEKKIRKYFSSKKIKYFNEGNLFAPLSSGSFLTDGMFVVPCSMKTLSGIAQGYANNLIERAADVMLKEGRKLILAPREMPFSAIHLENMLKLARLGVRMAAPVPAFYQKPEKIDDIVDFVVGKVLDSAGVRHSLFKRWGS
ncbi:MAG TPA: UbiX family flavin prenyltransferase [Nitrospirae bacterium]|nr:putative aromatic acid decarboxylase [bacterium BMS3Abin10]GBE37592.1 putative aromatic acid decarboxylase [bacterium BMS3Bbin08]HDH51657.1 UbiX family flavin prenyltransferase [Nitrospirota bacterium]HDK17045.1 UbiX family flavin prenyltransferase [Nitrospirota bacterium]HDK82379.1 UbiX family flavin prenyltransferase [Nitrospirota bacterium]